MIGRDACCAELSAADQDIVTWGERNARQSIIVTLSMGPIFILFKL
jgi:hypothetical protein